MVGNYAKEIDEPCPVGRGGLWMVCKQRCITVNLCFRKKMLGPSRECIQGDLRAHCGGLCQRKGCSTCGMNSGRLRPNC